MTSITLTRTRKVGGSLVVTLPRELIMLEGIGEDEVVEVSVHKHKTSFRGILKDLAPFKKEDKLDVKNYS